MKRQCSPIGAGLLALVVAGCATLGPPHSTATLPEVGVGEVEVRPLRLEGSADDTAGWFGALLSSEATVAVARAAIERQLAAKVLPTGAPLVVSGWVEVPVALPPGVSGSRAAFREGILARAELQLVGAEGEEIAAGRAELRWRDVRWTAGGPKTRRARRPEISLLDAVDLVVTQAIDDLGQQLRAEPASSLLQTFDGG